MKNLAVIFFFLGLSVGAQSPADSLRLDSAQRDTALVQPVKDSIRLQLKYPFTSDSFRYGQRLFFSFTNPVRYTIGEVKWEGKDVIFYSVVALLLLFAFIKNSFGRYLTDLYSSYFRTTMRQRQIKEQLLQSPLPSLLFNVFFVVSTAVFLALLSQHFHWADRYPFWMLTAYIAIGITILYAGKFLLLKAVGWIFQMNEAANTYIFVVFSTNKILGVVLLPFTILIAFSYGTLNTTAITLSFIAIGAMFAYRYFLSFISINGIVRVQPFHFLIYLAAFEVLPFLLINKVLFLIVQEIV